MSDEKAPQTTRAESLEMNDKRSLALADDVSSKDEEETDDLDEGDSQRLGRLERQVTIDLDRIQEDAELHSPFGGKAGLRDLENLMWMVNRFLGYWPSIEGGRYGCRGLLKDLHWFLIFVASSLPPLVLGALQNSAFLVCVFVSVAYSHWWCAWVSRRHVPKLLRRVSFGRGDGRVSQKRVLDLIRFLYVAALCLVISIVALSALGTIFLLHDFLSVSEENGTEEMSFLTILDDAEWYIYTLIFAQWTLSWTIIANAFCIFVVTCLLLMKRVDSFTVTLVKLAHDMGIHDIGVASPRPVTPLDPFPVVSRSNPSSVSSPPPPPSSAGPESSSQETPLRSSLATTTTTTTAPQPAARPKKSKRVWGRIVRFRRTGRHGSRRQNKNREWCSCLRIFEILGRPLTFSRRWERGSIDGNLHSATLTQRIQGLFRLWYILRLDVTEDQRPLQFYGILPCMSFLFYVLILWLVIIEQTVVSTMVLGLAYLAAAAGAVFTIIILVPPAFVSKYAYDLPKKVAGIRAGFPSADVDSCRDTLSSLTELMVAMHRAPFGFTLLGVTINFISLKQLAFGMVSVAVLSLRLALDKSA